MDNKTIGERIKELRKQQRMSIDVLAKKCGKSRATLYRYENGDIKKAPYTILVPIANALNTTPTKLMGLENEEFTISNDYDIWQKEFANVVFTNEEMQEIVTFTKYLLSKRDKQNEANNN